MGKKKHNKAPREPVDALLDAAVTENTALAKKNADKRPLTRMEVLSKLDQVYLLNLVATTEDGQKQIIPDADGRLRWFSSVLDAKAALQAMQAKMPPVPGFSIRLDFTPLGRAYSLSDKWVDSKKLQGESPPMAIEASSRVLAACGQAAVDSLERSVPGVLRKRNPLQRPIPLFFLDELQSDRILPFFFSREDLASCWAASGKRVEDLPSQLNVTDLRALVARTLSEENDWLVRLRLVPSREMCELLQMVDAMVDQLEDVSKVAAQATGEALKEAAAAKATAVAAGDLPPPLQ